MALGSCQEEEPIDNIPESWDNIILGEYEGSLEIFYEDHSLDMESIKLTVKRIDNYYSLILDPRKSLSLETLDFTILSIQNFEDEYDAIYVDIIENIFYKTKEVGAFKNVIYTNQNKIDETVESNIEIRLSLISLSQDDIRNIFIRVKKCL